MQENGNDIVILFTVSSLLIALIVILALIFLFSYQKKMVKQNLQIQQGKLDLQQKLLIASIDAQEKERRRIASDLHDDIGSLLSAIKLNVKHLKTVDQVGKEEQEFLEQTATMLDDGITSVRNVSYNLLPPTLVRFGIWEALKELIKRINDSKQISVVAHFSKVDNCRLDEAIELSIFRVFQELIANTTHHSEATTITITSKLTTELEFTYSDNGKGITDNSQLQGLGMINMQSRIRAAGGSISISEANVLPFLVNFKVPMPQNY
ncbi:MAG: signal transduction histidine kinase [Crocinitomicaceae bacterium]|jgi:signal transduction histidine kinase